MLRVRKALDARDMPFQLRYIGQPDLGDKTRPTVVRSSLDIACSGMLIEFLNELGCRIEFEYSVKGKDLIKTFFCQNSTHEYIVLLHVY